MGLGWRQIHIGDAPVHLPDDGGCASVDPVGDTSFERGDAEEEQDEEDEEGSSCDGEDDDEREQVVEDLGYASRDRCEVMRRRCIHKTRPCNAMRAR